MAMKNLVVEDGVPIPPPVRSGITAALRSMKPGQSVFVPGKQRPSDIGTILKVLRNEGLNLTARKAEGGVRVWRLPNEVSA